MMPLKFPLFRLLGQFPTLPQAGNLPKWENFSDIGKIFFSSRLGGSSYLGSWSSASVLRFLPIWEDFEDFCVLNVNAPVKFFLHR